MVMVASNEARRGTVQTNKRGSIVCVLLIEKKRAEGEREEEKDEDDSDQHQCDA